MNKECLSHLLTETERNHFEKQGYLYVPNALSSDVPLPEHEISRAPREKTAEGIPKDAMLFV